MPYVTNDGVRIVYEVFGQGRPIVLLHGWCGDRTWWNHGGYVEDLQRDYRLLNMDLRGHGESAKPHDPAAYSDEAVIGDLLAVVDAEGVDRFAIWGLSYGGSIGWRTADAVPDRVAALITTGAWSPPSPGGVDLEDPWNARLYRDGVQGLVDIFREEDGDAHDREFPAWAEAITLRADAQALLAVDARPQNAIPGPEHLAMPALLIAGELEDPDDEAAAVAARIPNGASLRVPGLGHGGTCAAGALSLPTARGFLDRWYA